MTESFDERLAWHLQEAKKLAIINDQRAKKRAEAEEKKIKKLEESGIDTTEIRAKLKIPNSISQSTARKMEKHELDLGDICQVKGGKHEGKVVLVIKAGVQTKFGIKAITIEYSGEHQTGERVWVSPELLVFNGERDMDTANAIKEADYQEWKARQGAGVPPKSSFKPKNPWGKKKESDASDDFQY